MAENSSKPRRYFTHGQLIVSVRHQQNLQEEDIFNAFSSDQILQNLFNGEGIEAQISEMKIEHVFKEEVAILIAQIKQMGNLFNQENMSFQEGSGQGFVTSQLAFEFPDLQREEPETVEDDKIILLLAAEVTQLANPTLSQVSDEELERLLNQPPSEGKIQIIGAAPNWYFAPAQGGSLVTGGPGTKPVPPDFPEFIDLADAEIFVQAPAELAEGAGISAKMLPANVKKKPKKRATLNRGKKPAHVIVLDTIPPVFPREGEDITAKLVGYGNNFLLDLMDKMNGRCHYYPFTDEDEFKTLLDECGNVLPCSDKEKDEVDGHDYDMSDHGLFISGLIHQTQPSAEIDLIQVLNNCGVGTLKSLLWGLDMAYSLDRTHKIINCSLTIGFEESELRKHCGEIIGVLLELVNERLMISDETGRLEAYLREIELVIGKELPYIAPFLCVWWEDLLSELTLFPLKVAFFIQAQQRNTLIVGAAGNDGSLTPTRYPAAFSSVIGIGALDNNDNQAPYSNIADEVVGEGFWTFGGDAADDGEYAHSERGLLGVYTAAKYPDGRENKKGWACWAGTSFATAVISGSLALLHSHDKIGNDARNFLNDSVSELSIDDKQMVKVKQGS